MNSLLVKKIFLICFYFGSAIVIFNNNVSFAYKEHVEVKFKKKSNKKKAFKSSRKPIRWKSFALFQRRDLKKISVKSSPILYIPQKAKSSHLLNSFVNDKLPNFKAFSDPRTSLFNSDTCDDLSLGQIEWPEIAKNIYLKEGRLYSQINGNSLLLTLNPDLQEASLNYLNQKHIVDGATVIIEPKTGRILAFAHRGGDKNAEILVTSRAPAASLMKIVTSAATIEKENLDPYDSLSFRGGCLNLINENWIADPTRDRQFLTFAKAFGVSCNAFFGRLALYHSGLSSLREFAERFMFNKPTPSDIKIQTSLFLLPDPQSATSQEVAEAGAGFGATKLSPIHAALLSSTISNGGVMMAPYLIDAAYDKSGKEIYKGKPNKIGFVVSKETARKIETLMLATVSSGTSRKVFHKKGTRNDINEIGGKTGTLLDPENRDLLYTWFSGIAPLNSPSSIAIGTVVASFQNWVVRASSIAQTTLAEYLKLERNNDSDPKIN